jgi:dUTP pyrophosphatase
MKILITENGRRHYYYEDGDIVNFSSDNTEAVFEVYKVDIVKKLIITQNGVILPLSTNVRPTKETLNRAKVDDRRVRKSSQLDEVLFAKLKDDAIIPSKDDENGGYDVYANFEEDYIVIKPHTTVMIPTKICSAFSSKYVFILKERGSTGTKGMGQRSGVIDSGYRGEWLVPITNENDKPIYISKTALKSIEYDDRIDYPYEKAICQAILVEVPKVKIREISADELKAIPSKRGEGKLGASGK